MLFIAPPQPDNSFTYFVISLIFTGIGTVLGIIVTLLIARKQRNRKEISYEIVSDTPIANINKEVKDRVEIQFDGKTVRDLSLVILRVSNTGNRAVTPSDFGKPIRFEFDGRTVKDANVLSASSTEVLGEEEMKPLLAPEQNAIILNPLLLNPKDLVTIKVLVDGLKGTIKGTSRIAEGTLTVLNTKKQPKYKRFIRKFFEIFFGLAITLALLHLVSLQKEVPGLSPEEVLNELIRQFWDLVFIVIAVFLFGWSFIDWLLKHRKQSKNKKIAYQIISDTPIANINKAVKDRVEIIFDGKPVKEMSLVLLKIWNKGGLAVRREDFDEPIKFLFIGRSYITGEVTRCEPEEILKAEEQKDFLRLEADGSIRLPRFLLNPSESINIKMLVRGKGKIKGTSRIVDGTLTEIGNKEQPTTIGISPIIAAFCALIGTVPIFLHFLLLYGFDRISSIFFNIFILVTLYITLAIFVFAYTKFSILYRAFSYRRKVKITWF